MSIPKLDRSQVPLLTEQLLSKAIVPNSLGVLGKLAIHLALIKEGPLSQPYHLLFCGDHQIALEGVTHSPVEITWQQCRNFGRGGGACSLFSRLGAVTQWVIDVAVDHTFEADDGVIDAKVARSAKNFLREPALGEMLCTKAISVGSKMARAAIGQGCDLLILGEMGVGNTTAASALASALLGVEPAVVTGRGSGLDDAGLSRKVAVVQEGLMLHRGRSAMEVLSAFGGFECAALVGAMIEGARSGTAILLDGFVVSAAALVAASLEPNLSDYLIAAHRSPAKGHQLILDALGCSQVLLDLSMQLGEGTGALAAWPLVRLASHLLEDLTSFFDAGVTDSTTLLRERGIV
jgi:nicotinate-nucleotide--dimethylbenzimidazole phosphoribosyltransferase